eukprot:CAMPEP_0119552292 /NCGR_PEP_ID=MMETSP1352-20130426/5333_1 /TAXON_ID=265584 /ORGANISM="Stauroneis constricta, Strain CCMP1120" /LENGTH=479 /DNA_ID=CAMNT_0007598505 /DNA_START=24 /DNA_END=1463 /DNA_ORIENTATION=-
MISLLAKVPLLLLASKSPATSDDGATTTTTMTTTRNLSDAQLPPSISALVEKARGRFQECFSEEQKENGNDGDGRLPFAVAAPGRVNLIGEHTDYTGGFVLPLAIDYSTVVYGVGKLEDSDGEEEASAIINMTSSNSPDNEPTIDTVTIASGSVPPKQTNWTTYVAGTVFQYLPDLPAGKKKLSLTISIAGDVPIGSGLSSSAALEVATARFVEHVLGDAAFSSEAGDSIIPAKVRALRCQKAENEWCNSPCGIMDQYVSSAASKDTLLLIDCRSLEYAETKMAKSTDESQPSPVLVVTNSNVKHDIAGGEYPVRVAQCKTATSALASINPNIKALRDATLQDVMDAKEKMDEISFKRARHVTTENERTCQAKAALEGGDWELVGKLMNDSHSSMRDDYEVSCSEIDVLVDLAQKFEGVHGSRLTGGGFGGCTVTLVEKSKAEDLMDFLKQEYAAKTGKECFCFVTSPAVGTRVLGVDG